MLSISCHVYYKLMLLFYLYLLLLISRQTPIRNTWSKDVPLTNYRRIIMKCSSVFGWSLKNRSHKNYCIHDLLVKFSRIISKYSFHLFVFFKCELPVLWLSRNSCHLAKSLQYWWKQRDWYGPSPCRGYMALGALSFSLHVMLHRHFLSWNVCWNG